LRKGKIKIESEDTEGENIEYIDLIIFSSSLQLDTESPDNLMLSVPELKDAEQDNLDAHFSLSADKPVLPDLFSKSSPNSDLREVDTDEILKRKVESLMVNIKRSERSQADIEFFLVDMKNIDSDQFGIDLDEEPKRKNSEKTSESTIHSSEKLKSRASDFGEDLTKHISEESISKVDKEITESKDKDEITGWDFGKRFWGLSPTSGESNKKELDKTEQKETIIKQNVFDDSKLGDEKDPAETTIKKNKIENLEIDMDDFQVSEKEEKIGKFERVRSITSSLNEEALSEESKGSEKIPDDNINIEDEEIDHDDEYKKITSKAEQFQSDKTKKPLEETVVIEKKKDNVRKDIKLNRAEAVRKHRRESRKSSAKKFLTIAFVFIVIAGVLYFLLRDSNIKENVEETLPPIERIDNATYIERTYDIPVTYPYLKPETKIELTGFISKDSKDVKPEKIIEDKAPNKKVLENNPPINNKIVVEKPTTSFLVKKPSGTPVQSAYNIYKYKDIYIVQVAAFRRKNSAENEAEKYIAKGYNAFLEEAKIDGITWYRVRVGNFDTLEKAKRFRKSNN
jgi:cell division septation protein DedD